jgi:NAD(P)-dependent dehydrogenase (short-subunit alcohol dehydrogenase family)
MVTGPGPYYSPLADLDRERAHRDFDAHLWLTVGRGPARHRPGAARRHVAVHGRHRRRRPGIGLALISAGSAALHALIANLALEVAPVRVNLIAPGFVDTPLSASLLGKDLTSAATSSAPRSPSGAWSGRPTSQRSPCTS